MLQHTGMGVARRAAEHARLRTEGEADEAAFDVPDEAERVEVAVEEVLATIATPLLTPVRSSLKPGLREVKNQGCRPSRWMRRTTRRSRSESTSGRGCCSYESTVNTNRCDCCVSV